MNCMLYGVDVPDRYANVHSPICKFKYKFGVLDFLSNVVLFIWRYNYDIVIAHNIFAAKGCSCKLHCTSNTQVVKALSFHLHHEVNQTVSVHILFVSHGLTFSTHGYARSSKGDARWVNLRCIEFRARKNREGTNPFDVSADSFKFTLVS